MKRLFDLIVVLVGAPLWLPLFVATYLLVLRNLGRPVLFTQLRPGYRGVPFALVKFRSMSDARDANGQLLPDDERLSNFGKWLRSTSLDELPELLHVLRGEMSLVGPRPLLIQYLPLYSARHARRHEVKPGVTGWAQINGRNAISWDERLDLDVWYVENRTLLLDVKILMITLWKVISREGINAPGVASMPLFTGSSLTDRV